MAAVIVAARGAQVVGERSIVAWKLPTPINAAHRIARRNPMIVYVLATLHFGFLVIRRKKVGAFHRCPRYSTIRNYYMYM